MKRLFILAAILALPFVNSCKKSSEQNSFIAAAILGSGTDDYWQLINNGIVYQSGLLGVDALTVYAPDGDYNPQSQLEAIEELKSYKKLSGLIISPLSKEVEEAAASLVASTGAILVTVDSPVGKDSPIYDICRTQVYTDNEVAVKELYERIQEDNHRYILFVGKSNTSSAVSRREEAAKIMGDNYLELVVDMDKDDIPQLIKKELELHPMVSAVTFLHGSLVTEQTLDACKGKFIYSFDYTDLIGASILNGTIKCTARQYTYEMGIHAVNAWFSSTISNPYLMDVQILSLKDVQ